MDAIPEAQSIYHKEAIRKVGHGTSGMLIGTLKVPMPRIALGCWIGMIIIWEIEEVLQAGASVLRRSETVPRH